MDIVRGLISYERFFWQKKNFRRFWKNVLAEKDRFFGQIIFKLFVRRWRETYFFGRKSLKFCFFTDFVPLSEKIFLTLPPSPKKKKLNFQTFRLKIDFSESRIPGKFCTYQVSPERKLFPIGNHAFSLQLYLLLQMNGNLLDLLVKTYFFSFLFFACLQWGPHLHKVVKNCVEKNF